MNNGCRHEPDLMYAAKGAHKLERRSKEGFSNLISISERNQAYENGSSLEHAIARVVSQDVQATMNKEERDGKMEEWVDSRRHLPKNIDGFRRHMSLNHALFQGRFIGCHLYQ